MSTAFLAACSLAISSRRKSALSRRGLLALRSSSVLRTRSRWLSPTRTRTIGPRLLLRLLLLPPPLPLQVRISISAVFKSLLIIYVAEATTTATITPSPIVVLKGKTTAARVVSTFHTSRSGTTTNTLLQDRHRSYANQDCDPLRRCHNHNYQVHQRCVCHSY